VWRSGRLRPRLPERTGSILTHRQKSPQKKKSPPHIRIRDIARAPSSLSILRIFSQVQGDGVWSSLTCTIIETAAGRPFTVEVELSRARWCGVNRGLVDDSEQTQTDVGSSLLPLSDDFRRLQTLIGEGGPAPDERGDTRILNAHELPVRNVTRTQFPLMDMSDGATEEVREAQQRVRLQPTRYMQRRKVLILDGRPRLGRCDKRHPLDRGRPGEPSDVNRRSSPPLLAIGAPCRPGRQRGTGKSESGWRAFSLKKSVIVPAGDARRCSRTT